MLWLSDPGLAFELFAWTMVTLLCKVGTWLVWPLVTLIMHDYRKNT